ncbi:putative pentatricopeptide repeat-containing protein [Spatholobus suberectus]|nr:putative pentatricopeptide repeat-containing protein [Spatholobus suberectus]
MLNAAPERFCSLFSRFQPIFLISRSISHVHTHPFFVAHNDELVDSFDAFFQRCFTLQQARQLHSQLVLTTAHRLPFLAARLIAVYARFGFLSDARKVFDAIPVEGLHHLLLWNSIIRANVSHGYHEHALELYVEMRRIFKRMELEGLRPNSVTWTSLLSSHARCRLYDETLDLFKVMRTRRIEISAEALAVVLSVCADMAEVDCGKEIHGYVVKGGYEDYLFVKNALIGTYGNLVHLGLDEVYAILEELALHMANENYKLDSCFSQEFVYDQSEFLLQTESQEARYYIMP